jgi:hypothetical protein
LQEIEWPAILQEQSDTIEDSRSKDLGVNPEVRQQRNAFLVRGENDNVGIGCGRPITKPQKVAERLLKSTADFKSLFQNNADAERPHRLEAFFATE